MQIDRNAVQQAFVARRCASCGAGHPVKNPLLLRQPVRELRDFLLQLLLLGDDGVACAPDQDGKQQIHDCRCRDHQHPALQPGRADGLGQNIGGLMDLRNRRDRSGFRLMYRRVDFDELRPLRSLESPFFIFEREHPRLRPAPKRGCKRGCYLRLQTNLGEISAVEDASVA